MDDLELLLNTFRRESEEMFDRLAQLIERFGTTSDEERKEVFTEAIRIAHNIKGAASTVGLESLAELFHSFEDTLLELQKSNAPASEDEMRRMLDAVTDFQRMAENQVSVESLRMVVDPIGSDSDKTEAQDASASTTKQSNNSDSRSAANSSKPAEGSRSSVRVESNRLDQLMNHAGETLITHSRMVEKHEELVGLYHELIELSSQPAIEREKVMQLTSVLQKIVRWDRRDLEGFGYLSQNISDTVKRMRMTPLQELAPLIRRTVRETSQQLKKDVKLTLDLGNIELDGALLDHLSEPFLHLLRNAIDHGIEPADERAVKGKPSRGQIRIQAAMERSFARIEISDDGRGMDVRQIASSAVDRGIVDEVQLSRMSHSEILSLVFGAFFSTSKEVSQISGRGVGLSVVKQEMESVGGRVDIESKPTLGGTTFYLTMPLSVLSIDGLMVRANRQIFAIPIDTVNRIVKVPFASVRNVDGSPIISTDELEPTKILWLSNLLGKGRAENREFLKLIVLERGSRRLGLVVNDILGEKEFVIERLPWNLVRVPFVNGAIKMADGSVALSLDVAALFDTTFIAQREFETRESIRPASGSRILVVDDSLTIRTLHRNILSAAGYDVSVCADGKQAWRQLTQETYDLLVADISMPEMDGYELTRRVKATDTLKHIPVILVTNLGQIEDKDKGIEAGAEEYIVKGKYDHNQLLAAVNRLIAQ